MSFFTALGLSFKNLLTKKGRTFLTSFAGSIGIIGIALVLAISNGFTGYINNMQSETLSGYPLSVATVCVDYTKFNGFNRDGQAGDEFDDEHAVIYNPAEQFIQYGHYNYISPDFVNHVKNYEALDRLKPVDSRDLNLIQYNYFTPLKILVKTDEDNILFYTNRNIMSVLSGTSNGVFYENLADEDFMMSQYDVIYQKNVIPNPLTDLTLVVGSGNKLSVSILNQLGITPQLVGGKYQDVSFEDICDKEFKLLFNDDYYIPNSTEYENITAFDKIDTLSQSVMHQLYDSTASTLQITRVIRLKDDAPVSLLSSGVLYSAEFAEYYRENCQTSLIAQKQLERKENGNYNFYDGLKFNVSELAGLISSYYPNGFMNVNDINTFLSLCYGFTLSDIDAFDVGMQQIGISPVPSSIFFYPKNFTAKKHITGMIEEYNQTETGVLNDIIYTDQTEMLTRTLGQLIDIISYILIAFASVSLVVSSIMIGIITYVSVIERTKEIGILRSIGARKKDISRVFNAETLLIGFAAGTIGVVVSYLLTILINIIIRSLAGSSISANIATLAPLHAVYLVVISMALTLISGLIPSRIASKKDPVVALRTE